MPSKTSSSISLGKKDSGEKKEKKDKLTSRQRNIYKMYQFIKAHHKV